MKIRNPMFNARGGIDCEVNDPKHGWIPFSAQPDDPEIVGGLVYDAALEMGPAEYVPPPPPSQAEIDAAVNAQVDAMLGGSAYAAAVAAILVSLTKQANPKMTDDEALADVRAHFTAAVRAIG